MQRLTIARPKPGEFAPFYADYIARAAVQADPVKTLTAQRDRLAKLLAIPESRAGFRYAPRKWTIREVVGHICDAERIFAYRLLRIARGDDTPLAGFDEDTYTRESGSNRRPLRDLVAEWTAARHATIALVRGLRPVVWTRRGMANGQPVSARALFYIIVGHADHHCRVLSERYGLGGPP